MDSGVMFYLNTTPSAVNADALVKHGDIKKFSIWAKNLIERGITDVVKGDIQEVSLVLAGKNNGANIENYNNVLAHSGLGRRGCPPHCAQRWRDRTLRHPEACGNPACSCRREAR